MRTGLSWIGVQVTSWSHEDLSRNTFLSPYISPPFATTAQGMTTDHFFFETSKADVSILARWVQLENALGAGKL
jgi:hypothetical protein